MNNKYIFIIILRSFDVNDMIINYKTMFFFILVLKTNKYYVIRYVLKYQLIYNKWVLFKFLNLL